MQEKQKSGATLVHLTPENLKKLKMFCAENGVTIRETVSKIVTDFLEKNTK